ncbi:hypothetical protein MTO96_035978 [Rhipicephalus appendiculatus]
MRSHLVSLLRFRTSVDFNRHIIVDPGRKQDVLGRQTPDWKGQHSAATFHGSCVPFPVVALALRLRSSSLVFGVILTSEKIVPGSPVGVAVGIVPGRPYCKAQRKVAAMLFLRGSVHVQEPLFDRCRGSSTGLSEVQILFKQDGWPSLASSHFPFNWPQHSHQECQHRFTAHRICLLVPKVFPVDILSALRRLCNRVVTPGPFECKPGTTDMVNRQRFVKDH